MRCFSPLSTPGVSTMDISFSSGAEQAADWNLERKPLPKADSPLYGLSGCTASVLPGVMRSSAPWHTTTKRSVVGSGPMLDLEKEGKLKN